MSNNKQNISTLFLLPGIQIRHDLKQKFYQNGFVNSYLYCSQLTYPFNVVYLVFQPYEFDAGFLHFTTELQKNPNFLEIIDAGHNRVMIVYRVPRKFNKDYELFLKGKYSKLSAEFRACFLMEDYKRNEKGNPVRGKSGKPEKEPTVYYDVFNRTDEMKNKWKERLGYELEDDILDGMELYDRQDEEKETFLIGFDLV